jgi:hypothetical protein
MVLSSPQIAPPAAEPASSFGGGSLGMILSLLAGSLLPGLFRLWGQVLENNRQMAAARVTAADTQDQQQFGLIDVLVKGNQATTDKLMGGIAQFVASNESTTHALRTLNGELQGLKEVVQQSNEIMVGEFQVLRAEAAETKAGLQDIDQRVQNLEVRSRSL